MDRTKRMQLIIYQILYIPYLYLCFSKGFVPKDIESLSQPQLGIFLAATCLLLYFYCRFFLKEWFTGDELLFLPTLKIMTFLLVALILTPPFLSFDAYGYGTLAWSIFYGGINPYLTPMGAVAENPWITALGPRFWIYEITPYGPLSHLFLALPLFLSNNSLLLFVLLYKATIATLHLTTMKFVSRKALWCDRLATVLLLNPVILLNGFLEGHNDLLLVSLVVLTIYLVTEKHLTKGIISLTATTLVKFTTLPLLPLLVFSETGFSMKRAAHVLGAVLLLTLIVLIPFRFELAGILGGVTAQSKLHCFYSCTPTITILKRVFSSDFYRPIGLGIAIALYAIALINYLLRSYKPWHFCSLALSAILFFALEWVTPWYAMVLLPFLALTPLPKAYPYALLGLGTVYSFYHYLSLKPLF